MSLNGKVRVRVNPYLRSVGATQIYMVTFYGDRGLNSFLYQLFLWNHKLIKQFDTPSQSVFTCNRGEIPPWDETRTGMKKILFTREFHPGMKRVEFHPGMKFNLKENLPLSIKTYNKIYHFALIC